MRYYLLILLVAAILCSGDLCAQFEEVSVDMGIDHAHISPTLIGGGIAIIDVDNDGWEDLYMNGGRGEDKLLLNDKSDGYVDVTSSYIAPLIRSRSQTTGVSVGDFNNDGWDDLFITTIDDSEPNFLLINSQGEFFTNITTSAGINELSHSSGSVLLDWNKDGLLDIYVLNYIQEVRFIRDTNNIVIGFDHDCAPNYLYINNGDLSFRLESDSSVVNGLGCALAGTGAQFHKESDGLYIANDYGEWVQPNELFVPADFAEDIAKDIAPELDLDVALYGMGIAVSDYNNDQLFDLYVTNIGSNAFMKNDGQVFDDIANELGVQNTYVIDDSLFSTGWGANFFDFDNDGYEDLFVANGYIPSSRFIPTFFLDPNKLYKNIESEFIDVSESFNMDFLGNSRGSITTDFDHDGDLDLVVSTIVAAEPDDDPIQRSKFYKNENVTGNFVKLKLEGVASQRNAFGTIVQLYRDSTVLSRLLYASGTHASQNSQIIHFGIGDYLQVDSILIKWPETKEQLVTDITINQLLYVEEGRDQVDILGCMNELSDNYNPIATINYACGKTTTSTNDIPLIDTILFPNPTSHTLTLTLSSVEKLSIVDISGNNKATYNGLTSDELDISFLTTGVYFVIIETDKTIHREKLIIVNE